MYEELVMKIRSFACKDYPNCEGCDTMGHECRSAIERQAADVLSVVRGKWIEDWETGCSECSVCHDGFLWEDFKGVADWKYCPSCGADMREEQT